MLVLSFHIVMKEEYKRIVMVSERMLHNIRNPNIIQLNFKRMFLMTIFQNTSYHKYTTFKHSINNKHVTKESNKITKLVISI